MKLFRYLIVYPIAVLLALILILITVTWQQELASKEDLEYLADGTRGSGRRNPS